MKFAESSFEDFSKEKRTLSIRASSLKYKGDNHEIEMAKAKAC